MMSNSSSLRNIKVGEAIRLSAIKFNIEKDCIITLVSKDEIELMYYDKELEGVAYKTLTKEDLKYDDYKLKSLN